MKTLQTLFLITIALTLTSFTLKKGKEINQDPNDFAKAIFNIISEKKFNQLDRYMISKEELIELANQANITEEYRAKSIKNILEKFDANYKDALNSIQDLKTTMELSHIDFDDLELIDITFKISQKENVRKGDFRLVIQSDDKTFEVRIDKCYLVNNNWKLHKAFTYFEEK